MATQESDAGQTPGTIREVLDLAKHKGYSIRVQRSGGGETVGRLTALGSDYLQVTTVRNEPVFIPFASISSFVMISPGPAGVTVGG
jgi:hypothetical protein